MVEYLIRLLGVDYDQWHALTRAALKLDLRTASLGQPPHERTGDSGGAARVLISRLIVYVFVGAMLAMLVGINKDVFFTGTIVVTYTMVMVAMLVLIDFAAIVISPDDFAILGYQPVSSRTYFISRLTNVLFYSTALSLALGIIPAVTYFFTLGFRPLLGIAAIGAVLLAGTATALFLVFVYAGILRVIHPNKLRRVVGYIQLAMSFLIYGGYMFVPRMMESRNIATKTLAKPVWLFLLPSTWFASYLDLARGHWGVAELVPACLSAAALVILALRARGRLALDYADRLSSATAVSEGPKKVSKSRMRHGLFFRRGESRAVALLVRNQFKYDQKFRLAVLSILPLTVLYLYMGLRHGSLPDPFVSRGSGFGDAWLLYFAVLMFPMLLKTTLANSDSYQASWIYHATPADRGRLVLASKDFVFVYFVMPYLAFLGAVFLYYFRNPWHVLLHVGVLSLLSHLFLQFAVFLNPVLPFSMPTRKAQRSTGLILVTMMIGPPAAIGLLFVISMWVYPDPTLLWGVIIGLGAVSYVVEKALEARVRRRARVLEYQG